MTVFGRAAPAAAGETPAVAVVGVERSFGSLRAITGVTLCVASGTVAGIVGPNGAGKTTLIAMICGLVRPSAGTIRVLGEDVAAAGASLRARIFLPTLFFKPLTGT